MKSSEPRRLRLSAAALLALALLAAPAAYAQKGQSAPDSVIGFSAQDRVMNGAIAHARETLPAFWRAFARGDGEFHLKVAVQTANGPEHLWVDQIERLSDGRLRGLLANEPVYLPGQHLGDPLTFSEDAISDWSVTRGHRVWGSFTSRVIFDQMSAAERTQYAAFIAALQDGDP